MRIRLNLILLLVITGIVSSLLVIFVTRLEGRAGIAPMAAVFVGLAIWSFSYAVEISGLPPDVRLIAAKSTYFGIVLIPGAWFVFALEYTGRRRWLSNRLFVGISVLPLVTLLAIWTNEFHHIYWSSIISHEAAGDNWFDFRGGPLFWIHSAYSYALLSIGIGLIIQEAFRLPAKLRKQAIALVFGILAPFSGSVMHVLKIPPFEVLDPAPIASLITGGMMIMVVWRLKFLRVLPIGREVIMSNFRDGMIVVDEHCVIVDINKTAEAIIGLGLNDVVLEDARKLFPDSAMLEGFNFSAISGPDQESMTEPVLGKNDLYYLPTLSDIDDGSGRVVGRLLVLRDITDRIEIEQQAANARSQFISSISHELRSPLTSISAFSDILLKNRFDNLDQKQISQISAIQRASRTMNALISDLSDISKSDDGGLKIQSAKFNVNRTIREIGMSADSQIQAKNQNLTIYMGDREVGLIADEIRFIQIVSNLISNASKYSPDNAVIDLEMRVAREGIQISVEDQGIGISEEDQTKLYTPFFRATNTETRAQSGSGLGLSIVKSLVELHGGEIEIESTLSVGTKVTIWLPGLTDVLSEDSAA